MPVRTQFLQKYDVVTIKKNEGLPLHKKIVMVMLGGRGSIDMPLIAAQLAKVKNVHCIFSIPKRLEQQEGESVEAIEKRIAEWENDYYKPLKKVFDDNAWLSATILQFRDDIAPFMACADVLITKSGGQTVSEALYLQIPMIIDARDEALPWEELNRTLVIDNNFGTKVTTLNEYAPLVQKIIDNPAQLAVWKQNIQKLELPNPEQAVLQVLKGPY
jgi:processive 1,2-diacylglycerol beta-glucosyltransferase